MIFLKPVGKIPLGLVGLSFQVCQVLYIIYIVIVATGIVEAELPRKQGIQFPAILRQQTCQPQGDAPLPGIFHKMLHQRLFICAQGEGIDRLLVELGEKHQSLFHDRTLLATPDTEICKAIFTAPVPGKR